MGSILINDNGVEDKIKKHDGAASKLGKAFGGLGVAAIGAGVALAAGFGAALISGIQGVTEGEDAIAQLDAVLKSTGGSAGVARKDLLDMADQMQKTTKFTQEEVLSAESLLLTFTNIGKETFPRATKAAGDMATALGTDMAGQSIALGKALNDPTKGITALTKVGVTFTEEQKKSIKAMQESGDMAGAQTVILKELEKEFGNSAIAAGKTFSGQLEILKNAFGEVTESLAVKFMPYLQKFMDFVVSNMPQIENIFEIAFDTIGKVLGTTYNFIKDNIIPIFKTFADWIKPNMPAIKEIVNIAFDGIKAVMKVVGDYITTVVIPIYKTMAEWFFKNFPLIKNAVMQAYDYIKPSFDRLVSTVKTDLIPIITGLWNTVKLAMPGVKAVFQLVMPLIVLAVKLVIEIIADIIHSVAGIYGLIKPKLDTVASIFSTVFGGIKKVIDLAVAALKIFNGTPAESKTTTFTTHYVSSGDKSSSKNPIEAYGFDVGTRYLPGDMLIQAHEGEMIVPKSENPYANSGGGKTMPNNGITQTVNIYSPTALSPSETARMNKRALQELAFNF